MVFYPKKVANCFKKVFTTVASKLVDKLPSSFNLFHTEPPTFLIFYRNSLYKGTGNTVLTLLIIRIIL